MPGASTEQEFPKDFPPELKQLSSQVKEALTSAGMYASYGSTIAPKISVKGLNTLGRTRVALSGTLDLDQEAEFWKVMDQFKDFADGRLEFYTAESDGKLIISPHNPMEIGA